MVTRVSIRNYASRWTLTALTVLFGLQLIRVLLPTFVNYLRDSRGMSALSLAPIALGVFALSFLAGPLLRLTGWRVSLVVTAGGVALLRGVEQLSTSPALDLVLVSAGVALFLMYIPVALGLQRAQAAAGTSDFCFALLLGVAGDTAIHTAAWTVDLSWQQGVMPIVIVVLLVVIALFALRQRLGTIDPEMPPDHGWLGILALSALGPWLFLQLVVFQNVARLGAVTGWPLPASGTFIGLGNVLGLIAAAHASSIRRFPGSSVIIGLIFVATLLLVETSGWLGALISLVGQVLAASLIMTILFGLGLFADQSGRIRASIANGIGSLLFVILSFAYYASFDLELGFRAPAVLPVAGLLVAIAAVRVTRKSAPDQERPSEYAPAATAILLLLMPLGLWLVWGSPQPAAPEPDNKTIRVMNYNLHNGFNTDGRLNMEALAQVIEDNGADVVGLQEVSRGWVVYGSVDMLEWLSQRLDMPYVSDPTEGLQWGNAVLSRYPIVRSENLPLPPDSLLIRRGYIAAEIDVGQNSLQVIDTHLHHLEDDSEIRQLQTLVLAEAWNGAPRTVIMGDFNAMPGSPELEGLAEAGLVDVSSAIGPTPGYTYYSAAPDRRIDYFWISPDLTPSEFEIPQTTSSDHLPLVTVLTLP